MTRRRRRWRSAGGPGGVRAGGVATVEATDDSAGDVPRRSAFCLRAALEGGVAAEKEVGNGGGGYGGLLGERKAGMPASNGDPSSVAEMPRGASIL